MSVVELATGTTSPSVATSGLGAAEKKVGWVLAGGMSFIKIGAISHKATGPDKGSEAQDGTLLLCS